MEISKILRPGIFGYAIQRMITWYPLRSVITRISASTKPQHLTHRGQSSTLCGELVNNGVAFLPQYISIVSTEKIKAHLSGLNLSERFAARRSGFTLDNVPKDVHVAEYATKDLLTCAEIVRIANQPELIDAAAQYLGCKPTISNISVWWSFPADGTAQEAENYHRDVDDFRFVKFFLYLTDVDDNSGPHCFVRGSHSSVNFLRKRRLADDEVHQCFRRQDCLTISGKTGDGFLEDTFGLHKGQPPISKRRLVLQVQYSINPIFVYEYHPCEMENSELVSDPYVMRLYIKS